MENLFAYLFVCLSVITLGFPIKALYTIPGSHQTPHIIYFLARGDVRMVDMDMVDMDMLVSPVPLSHPPHSRLVFVYIRF